MGFSAHLKTRCYVLLILQNCVCLRRYLMEKYFIQGGDASVNWYYVENDEDIKEAGLEFKEDMRLPFILISFKS